MNLLRPSGMPRKGVTDAATTGTSRDSAAAAAAADTVASLQTLTRQRTAGMI